MMIYVLYKAGESIKELGTINALQVWLQLLYIRSTKDFVLGEALTTIYMAWLMKDLNLVKMLIGIPVSYFLENYL